MQLVCKPGCGAFTEAACLGKPVVYLRRPNWPEKTCLIEWLSAQVPCLEGSRRDAGQLASSILKLLDGAAAPARTPDGVDVCVERMMALLG